MPDLSMRDRRPEMMDDPALDRQAHVSALRGLARLNSVSFIAARVWREVAHLARRQAPLRVLDVACGSGDIAVGLARLARREGHRLQLSACDVSSVALELARARAESAGVQLQTFALDVVHDGLPKLHDVVMCHLFLHHLDGSDASAVLAKMSAAAERLVLVTDLTRDKRGLSLALGASRLLTRSPVVHADALLSVRSAFRMDEIRGLARDAELPNVSLRRFWPRRVLLTSCKEASDGR